MQSTSCPLCKGNGVESYYTDDSRSYLKCCRCALVFVPPEDYLDRQEEKKRYDLHQNDPDDEGYRSFLKRLFDPMDERLDTGCTGLDFGSGPGPALVQMFTEAGYHMKHYDLYYHDHPGVFDHTYDFITASEVVEHLADPWHEIKQLWACLKPEGYLGIMTKLVLNREAFKTWHYIRDGTHICFFSKDTFRWLAAKLQAKLTFIGPDVIILHKAE